MDQEKALNFYTDKLGFQVKHNIDMGNGARWLTVVAADEPDGPEVLLEPAPLHFEPSKVFQEALYSAGIPWTQFEVDSVQETHDRLSAAGVSFKMGPTRMGEVTVAVLDDTCGNYIQLIEA